MAVLIRHANIYQIRHNERHNEFKHRLRRHACDRQGRILFVLSHIRENSPQQYPHLHSIVAYTIIVCSLMKDVKTLTIIETRFQANPGVLL